MSNQIYSSKNHQYGQQWRKQQAQWSLVGLQAIVNLPQPIQWDFQIYNNIPKLTFDSPSGTFTAGEPMVLQIWCQIRFDSPGANPGIQSTRSLGFNKNLSLGNIGEIEYLCSDNAPSNIATTAIISLETGDTFSAVAAQRANLPGSLNISGEEWCRLTINRLDGY